MSDYFSRVLILVLIDKGYFSNERIQIFDFKVSERKHKQF